MFVTARYYESAQQARDAVDDLKAEGFRSRSIALITPAVVAAVESGRAAVWRHATGDRNSAAAWAARYLA